ncbi:MAG: histidine kinase [Ignavibacteriaceae bacterium]|nr:histidine kinase [Ignavibacteriaceae bacterium]
MTLKVNRDTVSIAENEFFLTKTSIMKPGRKKLYWLSQICGWSLFVLVNLIIISNYQDIPLERIIVWIILGFLGIIITHFLRSVIRKNGWLDLPLKKIIPRVLISSLIAAIIIYALTTCFSIILGSFRSEEYRWISSVAGIINLSGISLVWTLIYFSLHYLENYQKAEIESLIWESAVKDFEIKTLKAQLNPHFMFNAMNSIRALIEEDPESAKIVITKLSNILRYSLKIERTETVTLEDEIKTIKDYLDLEKIRFEERLKYSLNISPDSTKVEIPPMMIQTLIENGIKHGISKQTNGGEVSLITTVDSTNGGSKLKIEIRNTGKLNDDQLRSSRGFGIANTKHRLSLLFGEEASFSIKNENESTVLCEIIIPIGEIKR